MKAVHSLALASICLALSGCGGDSPGALASIPPGPSSSGNSALTSGTANLNAAGVGEYRVSPSGTYSTTTTIADQPVDIAYDAGTRTYTLTGALDPASGATTSVAFGPAQLQSGSDYSYTPSTAGDALSSSSLHLGDALTYSSWGQWNSVITRPNGDKVNDDIYFTYGIRTQPSDMPKTGTATYGLTMYGAGDGVPAFGGSGSLSASFGTGSVSVSLSPYESGAGAQYNPDKTPFATLTGTGTIDAATSSFQSSVTGTSSSGGTYTADLSGLFYGPQAAELGATFQMYYGPNAQPFVHGVITGQKN